MRPPRASRSNWSRLRAPATFEFAGGNCMTNCELVERYDVVDARQPSIRTAVDATREQFDFSSHGIMAANDGQLDARVAGERLSGRCSPCTEMRGPPVGQVTASRPPSWHRRHPESRSSSAKTRSISSPSSGRRHFRQGGAKTTGASAPRAPAIHPCRWGGRRQTSIGAGNRRRRAALVRLP